MPASRRHAHRESSINDKNGFFVFDELGLLSAHNGRLNFRVLHPLMRALCFSMPRTEKKLRCTSPKSFTSYTKARREAVLNICCDATDFSPHADCEIREEPWRWSPVASQRSFVRAIRESPRGTRQQELNDDIKKVMRRFMTSRSYWMLISDSADPWGLETHSCSLFFRCA